MEKRDLHNVIDLLNSEGINVIVIEERVYSFIEFNPSDEDTHYSTLVGKDITKLLENKTAQMGFSRNEMTSLIQSLNEMQDRRKEFHHSIQWRKYLSYK